MKRYEIAVIGAGSGGLVAALTANRRGAKTVLIEKNKIGGECTHYGCIPSKTFINSARLYHSLKKAGVHGLPATDVTNDFNFANVMEHVDDVVQGIYEHEQPDVFQDLGIDVLIDSSGARFLDPHTLQIGEDVIKADNFVISTGSSPRMAPHEGSETLQFIHNENFWELRKQPKSLVFLGGGVISVEIGQSLARFGSDVTIIDRNDRILKVIDEEVGEIAVDILKRDGIKVITNSEITNCMQVSNCNVKISIDQQGQKTEMKAEEIFAALGRTPNIDGLDLEKAGVEHTKYGVVTNEYLQTRTPHIYACGDVTTRAKFTHIASYQAEICIENIFSGNTTKNDLSIVPWAIFMDPEIGHVGLSEKEAKIDHKDLNVFRVNTNSVDRFKTASETEGFLKIIMDQNDVILGADAIGIHAGEWIQFFTLAIKQKLPIKSLAEMIFIYPTFSEIVKKGISRYLRTKSK